VVTDSVRELFGDEVSALRLTDADDPDSLLLVSCQGLPADQTRRLWRASLQDAGISGRAVASGELVLVDRHDGDNGIEIKELTQFGLHAAMAAPVRDTGKIVGALVVASDRPDRTYAEVDRQTLVALAGAVSAAISDAGTLDTMYQAFHDPLTGLTSRALFLDRLTHALACADRERTGTGMLLIGLDRFRTINEGLGHAVGDQLLAAVAERIRAAVRNVDTAARFDGDEFAVLLHHLSNRHQAVLIARRVLHALRAPFSIMDRRVFITASIGVAFADPGQDDPQPLLRRADQALASAKRNGKGRYEVFTPPAHASAHNPVELENDLRQALERDELRLRYQPIVELADGRVTGFEALVRWEHPVHGMIPPLDFIPLAEESDLIVPIGTWVLEQACLQCARWNAERPADSPLTVSVNLSARQLQHADLCRMVSTALDRAGLPATSLTLEITESMLVQDSDATIRRLQQLKDVGVRLAIDDFGTGYSSLAYLRRFPVDIIKIDKIFVDDLPRGDGATLTRAIVGLGRSLRVATIAEGIEAADQCAPLRESGCELGQGYYFAKPLTPEEATGLAVSGSG
jgi:diguanylate cyclase (GGDEF)-like protein